MTRPSGRTVGRSLAECTARSISPSKRAVSSSFVNRPFPPASDSGRSWMASPVVLMTLSGSWTKSQPSAAARRSCPSCACASASGLPRVPMTRVERSAITNPRPLAGTLEWTPGWVNAVVCAAARTYRVASCAREGYLSRNGSGLEPGFPDGCRCSQITGRCHGLDWVAINSRVNDSRAPYTRSPVSTRPAGWLTGGQRRLRPLEPMRSALMEPKQDAGVHAGIRERKRRARQPECVRSEPSRALLLGRQGRRGLDRRYRRWVPIAGERLRLRRVEPHGQVERTFRGGKPVYFLVLARSLVLNVQVERAVGPVPEGHPAAHREAVEAVRCLKARRVVERDRPERIDGRRAALIEMGRGFGPALKRLAGLLAGAGWGNPILGQVGSQSEPGEDGPLAIVVPADAPRIRV